tara:strand:+ start:265 stop:423 length:159 start_codon:yes stop_codon:yes gene_type:complete
LFKNCPCGKIDSTIISTGDKTVLKLMSYNKVENIVKIKEAMAQLGITLTDLK